jgi:hypothetical protein
MSKDVIVYVYPDNVKMNSRFGKEINLTKLAETEATEPKIENCPCNRCVAERKRLFNSLLQAIEEASK